MRLVIHAPNVHQGGGHSLLSSLLRSVAGQPDVLAVLDSRFDAPPSILARITVIRVPPTLWGRLRAERRLQALAKAETTILCFGNLPPLFDCRGRVLLFLQNRYLTGGLDASAFPWRARLRIFAERAWLRWRIGKVHRIIVQSSSMAREVERVFGVQARVLPFVPERPELMRDRSDVPSGNQNPSDFLYVASGEPHKNHRTLLEAWKLLAEQGIRPSLCITLDPSKFPDLMAWIENLTLRYGLRVRNAGHVAAGEMGDLYRSCRALIFPSLGESFGLPLVEARAYGMPILAAERDYVRDVVEPAETFDPESPVSVARAVRRFIAVPEVCSRLRTPAEFLEAILAD